MKYLLDANAAIGLVRGARVLVDRVGQHRQTDFAISAIAAHEVYFGAERSPRRKQTLTIASRLLFAVLPFDQSDGRAAARIRAALRRAGTSIGPFDVLIAGQALNCGLILITHDTREFSRVEGLRIEDWEV